MRRDMWPPTPRLDNREHHLERKGSSECFDRSNVWTRYFSSLASKTSRLVWLTSHFLLTIIVYPREILTLSCIISSKLCLGEYLSKFCFLIEFPAISIKFEKEGVEVWRHRIKSKIPQLFKDRCINSINKTFVAPIKIKPEIYRWDFTRKKWAIFCSCLLSLVRGPSPPGVSQSLSLSQDAITFKPALWQLSRQAEDAGEGRAGPTGEDEHKTEAGNSSGENHLWHFKE